MLKTYIVRRRINGRALGYAITEAAEQAINQVLSLCGGTVERAEVTARAEKL